MKTIVLFALIFAAAHARSPKPTSKPSCLPYAPCCAPTDPNGCGIYDLR